MIVDPMGNTLAKAGRDDTIIFTDIDPDMVKTARTSIPCMTDRRQDIYG